MTKKSLPLKNREGIFQINHLEFGK